MADADGDGTVPDFSAIPAEVQELQLATERYTNQHHGWLPNGAEVLGALTRELTRLLDPTKAPIRGSTERGDRSLTVQVDDLYVVGPPIVITASVRGTPPELLPLNAQVTRVDGPERRRAPLQPDEAGWSLTLEDLPAGLYQITVRPQVETPQGPPAVLTAFEVVEP
jgi:hypothetical protein